MAERLMKNLGSFVDDLVSDPKNPPELTLLQGWLGASSEDKHRRLYLDAELSNSLEIPEDAILRTQELPADHNPLGGVWVWVRADAAIKQGPKLERAYARFLRGQIQEDYLNAVAGMLRRDDGRWHGWRAGHRRNVDGNPVVVRAHGPE